MLTLILTTLMSAATAAPSPSRLASGSHGAADDLNTSAVILCYGPVGRPDILVTIWHVALSIRAET